jgi:hypothetical protein
MKNTLILFFMMAFAFQAMSQEQYTISGHVTDADTGEELIFAAIQERETSKGTTTNSYGFFSLTLAEGTHTLLFSYVGYQPLQMTVELTSNKKLSIELLPSVETLQEVVITGEEIGIDIRSTEMSTISMDVKDAKLIPVLLGEQDILKSIQLMPGVSSSSEGSSGFFVRGGEADQNHILLDEAPVYNASHLLGFFSVFNSDALKDVKLYKGGIPARYGGRASSVMDIRMKDGNLKDWGVTGGIGLISSRLTVEGPFQKDRGSVIVSGRRTYADIVAKAVTDRIDGISLYFYDLNLKANYKISENDRLFLSAYSGSDVFGTDNFGFDWGNLTGTLRWNHIYNEKLFSNTTLIYSDYNYGFDVEFGENNIHLSSGIYDYNVKQDYTWYLNPDFTLRFGIDGIYHQFKPGKFSLEVEDDDDITIEVPEQRALETGVYIASEQKLGENLSLNYGLRLSTFHNIGPYDYKTYDENDEVTSVTSYGKNEIYNTYYNLEPRLSASYAINDLTSFKASYNRMAQYMSLLQNANSSSPTDMWTPATPLIKPTVADQVSLGWFRNTKEKQFSFSIEGYYKYMQNLIDYQDGADILLNPDFESQLVFGNGRAYGAEFLIEKNTGKLTGWIGYTLSKSEKTFEDIMDGDWFPARQDRTHDLSIVASYKLLRNLSVSGSWVYYTGDAVTFPTGKYTIDGAVVYLFSDRNGDRMPDYHRLDLGLTWVLKDAEKWHSDITFSAYNVYNRKNAYTITFQESDVNPGQTEAVRLSLFGIVPSVTWNFKF